MSSERKFVDNILRMTVPELQNELNNNFHTVVEQMILRDLIRRRVEQEYICQADKNLYVKWMPYNKTCIKGTPSTYPKGTDLSKYCLRATPDSCPLNVVSASENPYLIDKEAKNVIIKDNLNPPTFCMADFSKTDRSSYCKVGRYFDQPTNENELLSSRFYDDIRAIKQTHKKNKFENITF